MIRKALLKRQHWYCGIQKRNNGQQLLVLVIFFFKISSTFLFAQSPYCNPNYTGQNGNCTTYNMSINALEIKQSNRVIYSRAHNSGGYNGCTNSSGQYTLWSSSPMFTLKVGGTYSIGFTTGPTYNVGIGVWIDLNGDNDFADTDEWRSGGWCTPLVSAGSSTLQYFTLTIPSSAAVGTTRMRIRSTYNTCTSNDNGCTSYSYGEAEDFTINLGSDPNDAGVIAILTPTCQPQLKVSVGNLGNNDIQSLKIGWNINGKYQNVNSYSKNIVKGQSADITLTPDFNFMDALKYTIKVFTMEPNGVSDPDKNNDTLEIEFVYYEQAGRPNPKEGSRCGIGKIKLNAGLKKNNHAFWYASPTGSEVLAIDSVFNTPILPYGRTKYYIESVKLGDPIFFTTGLTGTYWFGNIQSGNMFDISAKKTLIIDSFSLNVNNFSSIQVNVYIKSGSYSGYQTNASAWTLIKSIQGIQAKGLGNRTNINLNGYLLPAGSYGIYVQVSEGILFNSGNQNRSNNDLSFSGGDAISGNFSSVVSNFTWSGNLFYRPVLCSETRVSVEAIIHPSPFGASFTKSTPFQTTRPNSSGTLSEPDIVASGDEINYELQPPTGYNQMDFGKKWNVTNFSLKTLNGTVIDKRYYNYANPTAFAKGKLTIKPDTSLTDSVLVVKLIISDLGPHFCDSMIERYIFVAPRPRPDFSFNKQICDGEAVLFENKSSISSGNLRFRWYFGTGNQEDTSDAISSVFKFPVYGKYKVSLTATSIPYGYQTTRTILVEVTEIPKIDFKIINACENVPLKFINTTSHSDTVFFIWDFGDPLASNDNSIQKHSSWLYSIPGVYQVTLKASARGCNSILTKNANQFATPISKFTVPSTICDNTAVKFTNSSVIKFGNMGYLWNFGDGEISTEANPFHVFKNTTPKKVVLKTISEFGCIDSSFKILNPIESPKADFIWSSACNLTKTDFKFIGTLPAGNVRTQFLWNFSGESTSTLKDPDKLFSQPGKKAITLTLLSDNGCRDEITKDIVIKLQSKSDFEVEDVCEEDDAVFTNKSIVSSGTLNYKWKFGDGKTSTAMSPRHRYFIGGTSLTFNVTLVAIVPGGCSDSVTKAITINAKPNSDFTYTANGRLVNFKASKTDAVLYQWRFGDGGNATTPNTQWNYLSFPSGKYRACLALVDVSSCFSETCKEINVSNFITDPSITPEISFFPNPNKGSFNIKLPNSEGLGQIKLYTVTGELIYDSGLIPLPKDQHFDLDLRNDIYILFIESGERLYSYKMVVCK